MELIHKIEDLERQISLLQQTIDGQNKETQKLLNSFKNSSKFAKNMFNEIFEQLKQENLNFETQFKTEKSLLEVLETLEKSCKSEFCSVSDENTSISEYNKVVNIADISKPSPIKELSTFDQNKGSNSISSLSNFLENSYRSLKPELSSLNPDKILAETFKSESDYQYQTLDSFTTIRDNLSLLENTMSTIFPPIENDTLTRYLKESHKFNQYRYNRFNKE